jgi:hypothetical protein
MEANSDACLAMLWHPNVGGFPSIFGHAFFMEK